MRSIPVVALLLAAGCTGNRRQQCDALIGKVNAASDTVAHAGGVAKPDSLLLLATSVDKAISSLSALPLRDDGLRRRRDAYVKTLASIATTARHMNEATASHDEAAMRDDLVRLQAAARDESAAIQRLNRECSE